MNKKHFLVFTCALVLAFAGLQAFAQSATDKSANAKYQAASAPQAKDEASQGLDPEVKAQVQAKLQKLASELNLTDDQKTQLKPILQGEVQQLKAVHSDASLSDEQKGAKMKEIHAGAKSQIGTILTPEQQQKLAAMKEAQEDK
jgi:Spy/CpxP family protein refolding chaperone